MGMNLNQAYEQILRTNGIFKFVDIGSTSLNEGVLQTAKLDRFIQAMQEATVLLDASRLITMKSFSQDIDRISLDIDLEAPTRTPVTGAETLTDQDPSFALNNLNAVKLRAKVRLTQEAIEDNIEQGNLPNTLTSLFGNAVGRSLEKIFIYGDTDETGETVPSGYKAIDGWIKKVDTDNKFYNDTGGYDADDIDSILSYMYDNIPRAARSKATYFLPPSRVTQYRRSLKARDTDLGDQANLMNNKLTFEGRPIVEVPALDLPNDDATFFGPEAMFLGPAENFISGMWKAVSIRSQEDLENDMWKFFARLRADCHFENEENVVVALPGTTTP